MKISKGILCGKIACALSLFFVLSLFGLEKTMAENLTFRYVVVNPSATKTQTAHIKKYLPEEVTPKDIVDSGGLELEYDTQRSFYYVHKEDIELAPKEVRAFEVEIEDIWIVPQHKIYDLENRTNSALTHLEGTEFYEKAEEIANTIYQRLDGIKASQSDESISRQQHIGLYRENMITVDGIKEDIAKIEKILVTAGGPPAPELLADAKIKAEAPTKTMTWIVIFVIVIFMGLLAGVMFFTWQRQGAITRDAISESKKDAFPDTGKDKDVKKGQ